MGKSTVIMVIILLLFGSCLVFSQNVSATAASSNSPVFNAVLLWNYTASNGVWSTPTVVNGVVYVGSEDIVYTGVPYGQGLQYFYAGNLYALNAVSGAKLWNYSIPVGGSSPAVADGIVYVGSFDGNVYAFNASNGDKLWSYPAGDLVSSSPAVADGIVYVGLSDGTLCALNGTTGREIWSYHSSGGVGSPVIKDGVVYVTSSAFIPVNTFTGDVFALNAGNGKLFWDYSANNSVSFAKVVGEIVYAGVGSNVSALSSVDGSQMWSESIGKQAGLGPTVLYPPAVLDNVLYVSSNDGSVYALNAANGEKIWTQPLSSYVETSPAVESGVVYIGSNDGNLYALNATNGETLWAYPISDANHGLGSSAVIADGVIYIGSGTRNVYAFGNPATPNTSSNNVYIIIGAVIVAIILVIGGVLIFRRLGSCRVPVGNSLV